MMTCASEIMRLSTLGENMDYNQRASLHKCAEAFRSFLQVGAQSVIMKYKHEPLLYQYSSDCTPVRTMKHITRTTEGKLRITRHARHTGEYLIQRAFLTSADGDIMSIIERPLKLQDKTAFMHLHCMRKLMKFPHELHHMGIQIVHQIYDRAVLSAMQRIVPQFFHILIESIRHKDGKETASAVALRTWINIVGCVCHDIHKSLIWAIKDLNLKPMCNSLWIISESARNGYDLLLLPVGHWLVERIMFEDWDGMSEQDLSTFYMALGVESSWLDIYVRCQPRFHEGRFKLARDMFVDDQACNIAIDIFMHSWDFRTFSDSTWLTTTSSSRTMVRSFILGLKDLVHFAIAHKASEYHIKGIIAHGNDTTMMLAATIATSSFVAEEALATCVDNDRLPLVVGQVRDDMALNTAWVLNMSGRVWTALATLLNIDKDKLKNQSMHSALVQNCFITCKVQPATLAPFTLLTGNAHANIEAFKAGPVPSPTWTNHWKIHTLLNMGFPVHAIHKGLLAMARASWSANITEQGHVAMSQVAKKHPKMKAVTMQDKALLISCKPLVQQTSDAHEKAIEKLHEELARLDRKKPSRCHGKHMMVRQLIRHGKHAIQSKKCDKWKNPSRTLTLVRKNVFTKHGKVWDNMLERQRTEFHDVHSPSGYPSASAFGETQRHMAQNQTTQIGHPARFSRQWRMHQNVPCQILSCRFGENGIHLGRHRSQSVHRPGECI